MPHFERTPVSTQRLRAAAKQRGVIIEINKGRTRDDRGEIVLDAPEGYQFEAELHILVNEQQDAEEGGLEPWANVVAAAYQDLLNHPIYSCPENCPCKE